MKFWRRKNLCWAGAMLPKPWRSFQPLTWGEVQFITYFGPVPAKQKEEEKNNVHH